MYDKEDIHKRYNEIDIGIKKFKCEKPSKQVISNSSAAFNVAIELVAAMLVGVIIGFIFDNLFDSKPVFLIICIMLAIVAAFRSIWNKHIKYNGS